MALARTTIIARTISSFADLGSGSPLRPRSEIAAACVFSISAWFLGDIGSPSNITVSR